MSLRYIFSGSLRLSPRRGAVVGDTGVSSRSYFWKASSKACLMTAFTWRAFL